MKHFLDITDATDEELRSIFDRAFLMRRQRQAVEPNEPVLAGRTYAMILQKPSLRTRASFAQAVIELGGHAMDLPGSQIGMGQREPVADVARVLGGMVHGIAARVFEHRDLEELARHASVPVINLLSDKSHPCQALADAMTVMDEFGRDLTGRTMAFIGDGNNVARSVAAICALLQMRFIQAGPPGYELSGSFVERLKKRVPAAAIQITCEPLEAVQHADVIYTDTWVSMGQEAQMQCRREAFERYQINDALVHAAPRHAIVLHCLPAHRGSEITDTVLEGHQSRVFPEAHNRLHAQKGLLAVLQQATRT